MFAKIFVVIVILCAMWLGIVRPRRLVIEWFEDSGYLVHSCRMLWLSRGGFGWYLGDKRPVYRLQVEDQKTGERRRAHARVGTYWGGVLADNIDVLWD